MFRKHFKEENKTLKREKNVQVKNNKTGLWLKTRIVETGLSWMQHSQRSS